MHIGINKIYSNLLHCSSRLNVHHLALRIVTLSFNLKMSNLSAISVPWYCYLQQSHTHKLTHTHGHNSTDANTNINTHLHIHVHVYMYTCTCNTYTHMGPYLKTRTHQGRLKNAFVHMMISLNANK